MKGSNLKRLVLSALFLAIGLILPLLTAQIKEIGDTLLPMHIPVLLCGLLCGPWYGLGIGFILPFLRSVIFGMPPIYPNAVWMAIELATYGFVIGFMFLRRKGFSNFYLYICLITSMISGRIVWGVAKSILLGLKGKAFTIAAFFTGGFVDALPGIILQLILIPLIVNIMYNYNKKRN